eukprot:scaffold233971_cov46-Prasinocladus_malaysianus.AAC.2
MASGCHLVSDDKGNDLGLRRFQSVKGKKCAIQYHRCLPVRGTPTIREDGGSSETRPLQPSATCETPGLSYADKTSTSKV